jgi:hypothetical protein
MELEKSERERRLEAERRLAEVLRAPRLLPRRSLAYAGPVPVTPAPSRPRSRSRRSRSRLPSRRPPPWRAAMGGLPEDFEQID